MPATTAVIGAGVMGRIHLGILTGLEGAKLATLVEPDAGARDAVSAEFGIRGYGDLGEMLGAEKPEYVVVSSPPLYHAEQSIAALEAGAHVLCEKPLCMSAAETEAIYDAAEGAGRLFTVGFHRRFLPRTRAIKRFLDAGKLGQIYHTRVFGGHVMRYPWGRFHHKREFSLGGVIAASTIHTLDEAIFVLGATDPVAVSASTCRRIAEMPDPPINFEGAPSDVTVEDFAHAHVRFSDGSSMSVEGNWFMHPTGRPSGFEILGTSGVIRDDSDEVELERGEEIVGERLEIEGEAGNPYRQEHAGLIAAIAGGEGNLVSRAEALAVMKIVTGIYASAEAGAEVRL